MHELDKLKPHILGDGLVLASLEECQPLVIEAPLLRLQQHIPHQFCLFQGQHLRLLLVLQIPEYEAVEGLEAVLIVQLSTPFVTFALNLADSRTPLN